jgi:hypothetical protein
LTFGYHFNQSANNLPQNITHLTFGYHFNQSANNLPQNITHLTLGYCFDQSLNFRYFLSLQNLIVTVNYKKEILETDLPKSLKLITVGSTTYNFN